MRPGISSAWTRRRWRGWAWTDLYLEKGPALTRAAPVFMMPRSHGRTHEGDRPCGQYQVIPEEEQAADQERGAQSGAQERHANGGEEGPFGHWPQRRCWRA